MNSTSAPKGTHLWIGLLCLLWGSTWVVVKDGLDHLPPFSSAGVRMLVAAPLMAIVALFFKKRDSGQKPTLGLLVAMGLCNFALTYGIVYWSMQFLPSGMVSLLWAVFPLMMAAAAPLFLNGESLSRKQWVGFLLGFVGVVSLLFNDVKDAGPESLKAGAIALLSPLSSAVGTVYVKKYGAQVSSNLLNRDALLFGAALLLGAGLLAGEKPLDIEWTGQAIFSVAYLAALGTVTTFGLYFWLLRTAPATQMSLIAYITPAIAVTLGLVVRGEPVTWTIGLGGFLIFCGVLLGAKR